ncbi:helix-turn-helix transcriptional regulator [Mogibacterium sp. NSJ-24]|uniref:Helix-turn-helix transcriptional regulator n=2 Tax=Lentihominibacter hominis TaxID=2763645 RepID=A0A926E6S0_9FIRM|nr:helix-turn-helix transcriptional regulator [Lentihominibacter hominis]
MDLQKVSERLTKLRGDESQAKVAEVIGISASALSMYECGERMPRDEIKVKLAAYYKTTVEALFYA